MIKPKNTTASQLLPAILLLLCAPLAQAQGCKLPSPFAPQGNYSSEPVIPSPPKLKKIQITDLAKLLQKLSGKWVGTAVKTLCKGSYNNEQQVSTEYTTKVEIESDRRGINDSSFIFRSKNEHKKNKTGYQEEFQLALTSSKLSIHELGKENLEILDITPKTINLRKRYFSHLNNGALRRGELIYQLNYVSGILSISDTRYINNSFSVKTVWSLQKKY